MAKHTINVSLSESSIQGAIRQIQQYKQTLQYKCELLVERLAELGDKAAIMSINESPLGKTVSMRVEKTPTQMGCKAVLIATGKTIEAKDRELFYTLLAIEFGAGIYYNSGNENPKANDFGLGVGTYPGQIHAFSDGWYYLGNDNQWHYTHGVKATMPMYNATMEIINQYKHIAREVFS
jgi:hypothetical protein